MRKGFAETVTKQDFKVVLSQLKEVREDLRNTTDAMVSKADLTSTIEREFGGSTHGRLLRNLETRVNGLEENLGGKPASRRS